MTKKEYIQLYKKFLSGAASQQELDELDAYRDEFSIDEFDDEDTIPDQELINQRIFQQITNRLSEPENRVRKVPKVWLWSAAAILLVAVGVRLFYNDFEATYLKEQMQAPKISRQIVPGANKAILILDNGSKVDLDRIQSGRIAQAGGTKISKQSDGQLQYDIAVSPNLGNGKQAFNTIMIPRGGQYQVILPDGTSVWLNSASTLKYPTSFTGHERHVELTGEAYFEVAKNPKMPFTVQAGNAEVKVFGTHFNITAYNDDPVTKTTLLEGSVKLTEKDRSVMLSPGQQGLTDGKGGNIVTKEVNVRDAVAWKFGYFSFKKENIQSAMRKISRWYDVEVVYQGKVSDKLLGGSITRTQSIEELLSYLEDIGIAKFEIQGRRIMVKPN